MNVLVIDGQGGGLGRQLVAAIAAYDMTRHHGYGRYARDTTFFCR